MPDLLDVCTSSKSFQARFKKKDLDFNELEKKISGIGRVMAKTDVVMLLQSGEGTISIYKSGKIIMKKFEKNNAESVSKKLIKIIDGE
ncbi:hypothetical protein JXB01_01835 [Candidatus Micrarchaeota archaeon]|nr:hypothetical protein [Candidatus Micrarchaeota archaeon]